MTPKFSGRSHQVCERTSMSRINQVVQMIQNHSNLRLTTFLASQWLLAAPLVAAEADAGASRQVIEELEGHLQTLDGELSTVEDLTAADVPLTLEDEQRARRIAVGTPAVEAPARAGR